MPLVVLLGSVLGFALLSLVAVTAGSWLRDRVGLRRIETAGAIGFLLIGVLVLVL
ncbi:MAG: TMEM165/GDT1 family protein [Euryarchaeota archaeon]|nr:TMEM165/GDT1 family protein [Euryarchaeota archaeon]